MKKGVKFIDFDLGEFHQDTKTAAKASMLGVNNMYHFKVFTSLPDLSKKSVKLVNWLKEQFN